MAFRIMMAIFAIACFAAPTALDLSDEDQAAFFAQIEEEDIGLEYVPPLQTGARIVPQPSDHPDKPTVAATVADVTPLQLNEEEQASFFAHIEEEDIGLAEVSRLQTGARFVPQADASSNEAPLQLSDEMRELFFAQIEEEDFGLEELLGGRLQSSARIVPQPGAADDDVDTVLEASDDAAVAGDSAKNCPDDDSAIGSSLNGVSRLPTGSAPRDDDASTTDLPEMEAQEDNISDVLKEALMEDNDTSTDVAKKGTVRREGSPNSVQVRQAGFTVVVRYLLSAVLLLAFVTFIFGFVGEISNVDPALGKQRTGCSMDAVKGAWLQFLELVTPGRRGGVQADTHSPQALPF